MKDPRRSSVMMITSFAPTLLLLSHTLLRLVLRETQGVGDGHSRDIVLSNLQHVFLTGFAANTPGRRLLAAKLSVGLTRAAASEIFGISPKTIQRGKADLAANPSALIGQSHPKQKRQRMDPQRHQEAVTLLDSLAPVQSGRSWRVVRCTEDHLYETYVKRLTVVHPSQQPVSKSYFIEHVLDKKHNLVHHESFPRLLCAVPKTYRVCCKETSRISFYRRRSRARRT